MTVLDDTNYTGNESAHVLLHETREFKYLPRNNTKNSLTHSNQCLNCSSKKDKPF